MNPYSFFKIVFFVLAYGTGGSAFSINNFFANDGKQVLFNGVVQYGAYVGGQAVGNHLSPAILFPIVANSKVAADFIQAAGPLPSQGERAATVSFSILSCCSCYKIRGYSNKRCYGFINCNVRAVYASFYKY